MYLFKPLQLLRFVHLVLLLAPVIYALRIPDNLSSKTPYDDTIVRDVREAAPQGFIYVGDLPDDTIIRLEISMRGRDIPGLVKQLYAVSTPGSPSYGRYLSKEEAESYARPTDETVHKINAWLDYYGAQSQIVSPSGDRLRITLPVSKANKMLRATFSSFRHTATGIESYHALSYSLPSQLNNMIGSVEPTTSFPNPDSCYRDAEQCTFKLNVSEPITPDTLRELYKIPTAEVSVKDKRNILSVAALPCQYANRKDLQSFLGNFSNVLKGADFTDEFIDHGENPQDGPVKAEEGTLDIQYSVGLANRAKVVLVSTGKTSINYFADFADYWLGQANPPTVVSLSYSNLEGETISRDTATSACNLYAQLGLRGVSILVSSGDGGVAGTQGHPNTPCKNNRFRPDFPPSCPFVTVVGASTGRNPEVGAHLSAGGFSDFFDQPGYQKDAVEGYLKQIDLTNPRYKDRFNHGGRAYPDISAQGALDLVIVKNQNKCIGGGTSVSTPIVASIITLLNDRLIQDKRPVLGFLNPLLYKKPGALNDITEGSNPGCNTSGFPAKAGWDPVTGLGTPNFPKMAKAIGVKET